MFMATTTCPTPTADEKISYGLFELFYRTLPVSMTWEEYSNGITYFKNRVLPSKALRPVHLRQNKERAFLLYQLLKTSLSFFVDLTLTVGNWFYYLYIIIWSNFQIDFDSVRFISQLALSMNIHTCNFENKLRSK